MPSNSDLESLLQQWEALTDSEADAIEAGTWDTLAGIQGRKSSLKARIELLEAPLTTAVRARVARLVEMERRNLESLSRRMEQVQRQLADLDDSRSKLRRIHQSYAVQARWTPNFTGTA